MTFAELHHQHTPLVIANVWDATSAIAAQQAGYQALGTSSAAIAAMLGYYRGQLYKAAGTDGLFVPCLTSEQDIAMIAKELNLPLNVMCMPDLATFGRLKHAGVSRISMGNVVHSAIQLQLKNLLERVQAQQSFAEVFIDESAR